MYLKKSVHISRYPSEQILCVQRFIILCVQCFSYFSTTFFLYSFHPSIELSQRQRKSARDTSTPSYANLSQLVELQLVSQRINQHSNQPTNLQYRGNAVVIVTGTIVKEFNTKSIVRAPSFPRVAKKIMYSQKQRGD